MGKVRNTLFRKNNLLKKVEPKRTFRKSANEVDVAKNTF
jgi:hypothetical protein